MAIPDERELDDWFEEQKELLADRLRDALDRGADERVERTKFDLAFGKLLEQYDQKYRSADAALARREKFFAPWRKLAARFDVITDRVSLWWAQQKKARKKRTFEREYKRLFKKKE